MQSKNVIIGFFEVQATKIIQVGWIYFSFKSTYAESCAIFQQRQLSSHNSLLFCAQYVSVLGSQRYKSSRHFSFIATYTLHVLWTIKKKKIIFFIRFYFYFCTLLSLFQRFVHSNVVSVTTFATVTAPKYVLFSISALLRPKRD